MLDIESKWDRIFCYVFKIHLFVEEWASNVWNFSMRHCNCKSKFRDVFNFLTWTPCMIFYLENITSYLFFVKLCHYLPDLTIDLISPLGSRMLISFNFSLTQIKGRCIHFYILWIPSQRPYYHSTLIITDAIHACTTIHYSAVFVGRA